MKAALSAFARRWQWRSLRVRILLATLLWVTLGIGGIWFSATRLFVKHVEEQYHEELAVHIKELAALVRLDSNGKLSMDRPLSDPRYLVPLSGFYWQVSVDGGHVMRSASMTRGMLDEHVAHDSSIHHHIEKGPTGPAITYGFIEKAPGHGDVHYVIATDERLLDETVASFTRELTLWLAALALALLATGLAVISFGLRPLDRLAAATARLRSGSAGRLEGNYPTEIAPLVSDINVFIEHNGKIVERARVEAGNLAHALRTPLAVITDEAERLSQSEATAAAGKVLLEQSQAMVHQIDYQLARARSAVGAQGPGTVSRLGEVLAPILSAMQRLHRDRSFVAVGLPDPDMTLPIDPVDLSELFSIVIDNAGKWSREEVRIAVEAGPEGLCVSITDDGPGLTAEQAVAAFDIGTRFDAERPGSGLGLAIARDIADAYGLRIRLSERPDGASGVRAGIFFPYNGRPSEQ
ncbi:sensor histidine kinase [Novosphingobium mangrovi (ex Huang et al. 2023)]|uniref:histidine kinase n=1 Tax=Novosphingobium mangrovi (ex Huang et al. 2023) TaxID=2976432 RepID=A0ABT2I964_9SPHN|nr:HAMP domain-containing sensor histidine kinase [Novosphingobium mangrovi (ex Huang et al. 2023)]MCT2401370.1 HAMP domain-containing histidine kinase [Novosphingobium mangrovi (ex Huang et al. 2023)]